RPWSLCRSRAACPPGPAPALPPRRLPCTRLAASSPWHAPLTLVLLVPFLPRMAKTFSPTILYGGSTPPRPEGRDKEFPAAMSTPIIVFALDGTLVDTAPDLLDSLNHCLAHAGLAAVDEAMLRQYVGLGGRVMLQRAFEAQGTPLDYAILDALRERFLENYVVSILGHSPFY